MDVDYSDLSDDVNEVSNVTDVIVISSTSRIAEEFMLMRYKEEYIRYGFTWNGKENDPKPKCIVCQKLLSNSSMTPYYLSRHLNRVHPNLSRKSEEYFKQKLKENEKQQKLMSSSFVVSEKALEASYHIAKLIAAEKVPHIIGETLVKPACMEIVRIMFESNDVKEINKIPLSSINIKRRIEDMSDDILETLISRLKIAETFAIQIGEFNVKNEKQFVFIVRFFDETTIKDHFLFFKEFPNSLNIGEEMFHVIDNFFKENGILWINCDNISMENSGLSNNKDFIESVKKKNVDLQITNCCIHRSEFISKSLPEELLQTMNECIEIVNAIKSRGHSSRIFRILTEEMGQKYQSLFLYTNISWLSHGKVLSTIYKNRQEISLFLLNHSKLKLSEFLKNDLWLGKLIYMSDIFGKLNELFKQMDGPNENVFTCFDKLNKFKKDIEQWLVMIKRKSFKMFEGANKISSENKPIIFDLAKQHLILLQQNFDNYYGEYNIELYDWVRKPFTTNIENFSEIFSSQMLKVLKKLRNDEVLKVQFKNSLLYLFWVAAELNYPSIAELAIFILLSFLTNRLCELSFSTILSIKNDKMSGSKDIDQEIRVALTKIDPNIELLCSSKKAKTSHSF